MLKVSFHQRSNLFFSLWYSTIFFWHLYYLRNFWVKFYEECFKESEFATIITWFCDELFFKWNFRGREFWQLRWWQRNMPFSIRNVLTGLHKALEKNLDSSCRGKERSKGPCLAFFTIEFLHTCWWNYSAVFIILSVTIWALASPNSWFDLMRRVWNFSAWSWSCVYHINTNQVSRKVSVEKQPLLNVSINKRLS